MKRVFVVASLMSLAWFGIVAGQAKQAESVLDRIIPEQPNGGPFVLTPPLPYSSRVVLSLGPAVGSVVGFEELPDVKFHIPADEIAADLKTRQQIPLAGKTIRQALDTIVAIDPRYRWIDLQGVPVVRPMASWTDPGNPLNQVVAPVIWSEIDLATAVSNVSALLSGTVSSGPVPGAGRGPVFSVRTGPIAGMELLNAIGVAHGGGVGWSLRYNCSTVDPLALYVEVVASEDGQPYGLGSCRRHASPGP